MMQRILLFLLILSSWPLQAAAEILAVSDDQQRLLGIEVQPVRFATDADAAELTLRVVFSPDGEWAIKLSLIHI